MKKNKSYSFISLILCFLLTFTSSCSNLSAILDKNTPNIQNLNNNTNNSQISKNENIVKKISKAKLVISNNPKRAEIIRKRIMKYFYVQE